MHVHELGMYCIQNLVHVDDLGQSHMFATQPKTYLWMSSKIRIASFGFYTFPVMEISRGT
jgi:hypothetical protein